MGAFALPLALAGAAGVAWASSRGRGGNQSQTLLTGSSSQSGTATRRTPRTDSRTRTPNAEETGRKAVPRPARTDDRKPTGTGDTVGGTKPPDASTENANAAGAAYAAQKRIKRRFGQNRPGSLLTGSVVPAELNARTLIGY